MIDLQRLVDVARRIDEAVLQDAALERMSEGTQEILRQAEEIARGNHHVAKIDATLTCSIEKRETAALLIDIMKDLPELDGSEEDDLRRAVAQLVGNLALVVTTPIYRQHPEAVPRR